MAQACGKSFILEQKFCNDCPGEMLVLVNFSSFFCWSSTIPLVHQPPSPPLYVDASLILLLSLLDIHLQDADMGPMWSSPSLSLYCPGEKSSHGGSNTR